MGVGVSNLLRAANPPPSLSPWLQIGSTFLQLKMVVDKGAGRTEDVFMELSLPQFYDFLSQMEKARTYVDFLSSSS